LQILSRQLTKRRMTTRILSLTSLRAGSRKFLLQILLLATFPLCLTAGGKKMDPSIAIRFHVQTNTFDTSFAAKLLLGNPPREVLVEKIPSISERSIASFYPYQAPDGSYGVVFQLDRDGELNLETISAAKRGTLMVAIINGRVVAALNIDKRISDGIIYVPSGVTLPEIRAMGASFTIMGRKGITKPGDKKEKSDEPVNANPLAPR
jgi:hypothetical protein